MSTRYTLPNGLTVVFECQHAAPVAAFQVWVKVGSADEGPDEVGLAHLHEHMLFKGTATRGLGEIAQSIEGHGGNINAWTSYDQTVYHVVLASRHARHGLDVLADAVRHSAFDAGELSREIEVVCEEIKRSLDMPGRRASKRLFSLGYQTHPYGRPVIGFEQNVRAHSRERVLAFYARHYTPTNMVLSAVGDFTEVQLRAWVDETFGGDFGRPPQAPPVRPPELPLQEVRVDLSQDDVTQAHLHLAFPIPPLAHPDTAALDVLAMLAGQGDASRLSLEVRRKRSLAKEVSSWAYTPREPGLFAASLVTPPDTALAALTQTLAVLATLTAVEVEPEELNTVKALIESEAVYGRETVQGVARKLGFYEAVAGGVEQEARYYEAVSLVTPAILRDVARRYLTFNQALVVGLLPPGCTLSEAEVRAALAHADANRPDVLPERKVPPPDRLRIAPSARPHHEGITVERLDSGATIIVREERAVPLFSLRAVFPGGLRYETEATNGLTALLTRTFKRGTKKHDAEELSHVLTRLAGGLGAVGGRNSMGLRGEFLSKHFEAGFELFDEVLRGPLFPQEEVERERQLLLQDIASRKDRPTSVAMELFAQTLYTAHPYRLSGLGEEASVKALTRKTLSDYHQQHMANGQLTVSVVGDVDTQRVLETARAMYGAKAGGAKAPDVPQDEWTGGPREVHHPMDKAQSHIVLGFRGACIADPWRGALELLSTILGGQGGRLFLELRDKRSMAYSVSAMTTEGVDPGSFAVYMGTSPEKVDGAIAGMREELDRARQVRVSDAELDRAKAFLMGSHDIGLQRNAARAGVMALDACYGLGATHSLTYPDRVAAVTADDVLAVAQRVIDFEKSALVVVGNRP